MNRQLVMQKLFQNMDALGRAAMGRDRDPSEQCHKNMPTRAQVSIMVAVLYHGSQSIKDLAGRFSMSSSAVTQLVNSLAADGYLTRAEDAADHRKICVELTAKGKKTVDQVKQHRYEKMEKILATLSDTELSQLEGIQGKIVQNLETVWQKNHHKKINQK